VLSRLILLPVHHLPLKQNMFNMLILAQLPHIWKMSNFPYFLFQLLQACVWLTFTRFSQIRHVPQHISTFTMLLQLLPIQQKRLISGLFIMILEALTVKHQLPTLRFSLKRTIVRIVVIHHVRRAPAQELGLQ
jgi:hypothetical protein